MRKKLFNVYVDGVPKDPISAIKYQEAIKVAKNKYGPTASVKEASKDTKPCR